MKPIAHRGYWKRPEERNSLVALESALKKGISVETDIRSFRGKLYLSHDPIHDQSPELQPFEALLAVAHRYSGPTLFLNIKEDGICPLLAQWRPRLQGLNYVFFDMSIPQLVQYAKVFEPEHLCCRMSDVEPYPNGIEFCHWIWVDGFHQELSPNRLRELTKNYSQKLAFVSPELHGRHRQPFWTELKQASKQNQDQFWLCTDEIDAFEKEFPHD